MFLDGKRFYIIFNQVNIGVSTAASIPNADQDRLDAASISSYPDFSLAPYRRGEWAGGETRSK
jgi:hypothetical protein